MSLAAFNPGLRAETVRTVTAAAGLVNEKSIALDGSDDYLDSEDIPHTELDGATSFSFWVKIVETSDSVAIMLLGTESSVQRMRYALHKSTTTWILDNGSGWATPGRQTYTLNQPGDPTATVGWHHIVFADTAAGGSTGILKVYINGAEAHEFDPSREWNPPWYAFTRVRAGVDFSPGYPAFEGNIDEITFWERTLSPSEVTELYGGGEPIDPTTLTAGGPTHWWRMGDEVSGTTLPDQGSGTALDITLINGAAVDADVPS